MMKILKELGAGSVGNKIQKYKFNWIKKIYKMENTKIPKLLMSYKPTREQKPERLLEE